MTCISLGGKGGGEMALYSNISITVPSYNTQRIQEIHLQVLHTLCALIEANLFGKGELHKNRQNGFTATKMNGAESYKSVVMSNGKH